MPKDAEHDMQVTHICTCVAKKLAELAYLQDATCCAVRGLALILAEFESQDVEPQYSVEDIRTEGAVVYFLPDCFYMLLSILLVVEVFVSFIFAEGLTRVNG